MVSDGTVCSSCQFSQLRYLKGLKELDMPYPHAFMPTTFTLPKTHSQKHLFTAALGSFIFGCAMTTYGPCLCIIVIEHLFQRFGASHPSEPQVRGCLEIGSESYTSRMKTCTHGFFKCAGHLLLSSAIICIGVASALVSTLAAVQAMVRISVSFSA